MRRAALVVLLLLAACGDGGGDDTATDDATPTTAAIRRAAPASTSSSSSTTSTTTSTTTTAPPAPDTSATPPVTSPPAPSAPAAAPPATDPPPPADPRIRTVTADELYASWRPGCPVGPDRLRAITVSFVDFGGAERTGTLIVHRDFAAALLGVFDQLHALRYPIERVEPVDGYGGDDNASMAVNNTSAFNCRAVTGGTGWSRHAYGTAIDLNPRQNPYVTPGGTVLPPEGAEYVDRSPRPGVINRGDGVVEAFAAIGWRWGGDFSGTKDYQHFDTLP